MAEQTRLRTVIVLFFVFVALGACTMANYGKLKSDPEVARQFQAYRVLPHHNYYYRGTFGQPVAIVGIDDKYRLQSKLWLKIDPASKDFRTLIEKVSLQGGGGVIQPWGFAILDAAGNRVGVWYSAIRAATIEVHEDGTITRLLPIPTAARGDQGR